MITRVWARNFKGASFKQPLSERTLFVGPNGIGKTLRAQALTLAVNGYIPGTSKLNRDIHAAYATAAKMAVGFELGGIQFERIFQAAGEKVSCLYRIDGAKYSAKDFQVEMAKAGDPQICDLTAFLGLSDPKKIEEIFKSYPPSGNLKGIESEVHRAKEKINIYNREIQSNERSIERLSKSRASLELPAGTLPELQARIGSLEKDLAEAQEEERRQRDELQREREAEERRAVEKRQAELKAKRDAEEAEARRREQEDFERRKAAWEAKQKREAEELERRKAEEASRREQMKEESLHPPGSKDPPVPEPQPAPEPVHIGAIASINRIIAKMNEGGCPNCSAKMTAIIERRKLK